MRGSVLDLLAYGAVRAIEGLLLALPPRATESLARGVGRAWFALDRIRREAALENVRVAFGDSMSPERRARVARDSFEHAFLVATEVIRRPRVLRRVCDARRRGRYFGDHQGLREDARRGLTGIVLTGHVGNWELAGAVLRLEGLPLVAVERPIENPYVDAHVSRTRGGGEALIVKHGAVRSISRALRGGRWVAILPDQNAGRHGVYVPFFGIPASTYPLAGSLAVRQRVPVYFGAAIRRGRGFRYDYSLRRVQVPDTGDERADARTLLVAFHAWLEETIRANPEQYFWLHRRWRSRPTREPPDPRLPAYARKGAYARRGARAAARRWRGAQSV